jgi:hypothetical protein
MIHIKRFMDRMTVVESRQNKDVVLPIDDARGLRDEVAKLLAELHDLTANKNSAQSNDVIQVEIKGGSFK